MLLKKLHSILSLCLVFLVICDCGCIKEYSYEGGAVPPVVVDTTTIPPITQIPATDFPQCAACSIDRDKYEENRWSFKIGNSFECGKMDTAHITPERDAFTFYGPSSCSPTTAMVVTVYLENIILDKDQHDLIIPQVVFTYAKLGLPKFLLSTQRGNLFSLTIESYNHQTRMAIGTFAGDVVLADGTIAKLHSGKFKVKLI